MTPKTVYSTIKDVAVSNKKSKARKMDKKTLKSEIARLQLEMDIAAANMQYEEAAEIRDRLLELKKPKKRRG